MARFGKKWKSKMFEIFMEGSINGNNENQSWKLEYGCVSFTKEYWVNNIRNTLQLKDFTKSKLKTVNFFKQKSII